MFKLTTGYFTWNLLRWVTVFLFTLIVVVLVERYFITLSEEKGRTACRKNRRKKKTLVYERFPLNTSRMLSEYVDRWFKSGYVEVYMFIVFLLLSCAAVFY